MNDEELKQFIASNAKAIEALTSGVSQERKERQRFERRLYQAMSQMAEGMAQMSERVATVAAAQASFWEVQADYYRRLEEMDERQAQIIEILNRLTKQD
jgi:predicted  nucleic acid-binding Zn-ribbon protein